ncbi:CubicO group peptidase (beta-lactamase class C family) [Kribbella sp. VKM Ac-2527]|uniref:CubicO group peptidase (Beta-lactamase class C family) n=1 Tax=Kribbella caucasensis TaxID=2512215 RepID=A0A4R6KHX6_9ACTN|nr:serine hydrolase domain-containing protein [Kribbella sp. VKM Ac-2527]TDO49270.1 CubicO group peptidase (beta-lactamase class C family) [Kribbella sp. VKM Ac-2527]
MRLRTFGAVAIVSTLMLTTASPAVANGNKSGRFDRPYDGYAPKSTLLRDSTPANAGLDPAPIDTALAQVDAWTRPNGTAKPLYAGAVTLLGHDGKIVTRTATGMALKYADGAGTELPADQQIPMRTDTIFDMASVSKLFSSIVVMQLVEKNKVGLDTSIATYVPEFAANGKQAITVRQALTHTTGLPAWLPLWSAQPDPASRMQMALTATPTSAAGTKYLYSDLNLIALGELAHRVTGKTLDKLVADGITKPLQMRDTGYNPDEKKKPRIAATEYQASPPRGMVWGSVHDENAWSLDGVAGHAGVFSTADDLAVLAQAFLNGGSYRQARILKESSVTAMITNFNQAFPGNDHGLGFELNQRWYMNGLSGPRTAGHTGYTGTSLVIDFDSRSFAILLTNRVHPSRNWGSNNPARRAVVQGLALSLGVGPRHGKDAWFSGTTDASTTTLGVPVSVPAEGGRLAFDLFVDTEDTDLLYLESSADGTTWTKVPFTVQDRGTVIDTDGTISGSGERHWHQVSADLAPGDQTVRWRYTSDALYQGRGVYVDGVKITSGDQVVFDGERTPESFVALGWRLSRR